MTIIAAVTRDRAIGRGGDMTHHISADLRRFKALTMGHPVVMGRKTFESLPNGPLPGRANAVITRNAGYSHEGIATYPSLRHALDALGPDAYVIGGGEIYAQAMEWADRLEITEIDAEAPDADTFFPPVSESLWQLTAATDWEVDPRSGVRYRFASYQRKG